VLYQKHWVTTAQAMQGALPLDLVPAKLLASLPSIPANMNEELIKFPSLDTPALALVMTLFKPNGAGPFPLLVMNHSLNGVANNNADGAATEPPARYYWLAREFVARGYIVALPMRQGKGGSAGVHRWPTAPNCDIGDDGLLHAKDVAAAMQHLIKRSDVDASQIVLAGASHGALISTALLASHPDLSAKIKANIGFSGGVFHVSNLCKWSTERLTSAYAKYGKQVTLPSLWLYNPYDELFTPALIAKVRLAYTDAGAKVIFADVLPSEKQELGGHNFMIWRSSVSNWWLQAYAYLQQQGAPLAYRYVVSPAYDDKPSGYARIDDVDKLPVVAQSKKYYPDYLKYPSPKVAAVSANGGLYYEADENLPTDKVLKKCTAMFNAACKLYSIDEAVVYK
jgi:dienelactone hydrolase